VVSRGSDSYNPQPNPDTEIVLHYGQLLADIREEDKAKVELASLTTERIIESYIAKGSKRAPDNERRRSYDSQAGRLKRILKDTRSLNAWVSWLSITPIDIDTT
jgi:hypothetical protein